MAVAGAMAATELQGVVADWNCTEKMVKNGRENTLRNDHNCSLVKNFSRDAYGLITDGKKYYRFDDAGKAKVKQLLRNTPDKDNLRVVVTGDIDGDTIKVSNITML